LIPNGFFASGFPMNIFYTINLYSVYTHTQIYIYIYIYIYEEVETEAVEMRSLREIAVYKLIDEGAKVLEKTLGYLI
jgi:hypothetical protein